MSNAEAAIQRAVRLTRLSCDENAMLALALAARDENGFVRDDKIRNNGRLLSKEEKAALGIKYRGALTSEYVEALNEHGLDDPAESAHIIASTANQTLSILKQLERTASGGVTEVKFIASNMLVGPCAQAKALDGKIISVYNFPALPMDECNKLGQCGCMIATHLEV